MPDQGVVARTALAEIEARIGIPPIEELLAERRELVEQAADLRARHGPFGTYQDLRKVELAKIAAIMRAKAVAGGTKLTEAAIDEAAHSDARYVAFITVATNEKAEWVKIEERIQGITDLILRANALARFVTAEAHL